MKKSIHVLEPTLVYHLVIWCLLAIVIGVLAGAASTAFLQSVDWAIGFRKQHDWMIAFLPIVGYLVALFYDRFGTSVQKGNNLILDEVHNPSKFIPFRMVPMIFVSTIISHLFGASVGREGAAVQMGAGISDQFSRFFGKVYSNRKMILKMGMSAGFASVFGAPIAGAIFGFEVLFIGTLVYDSLLPCLVAAIVGYYTALVLGVHHAQFLTTAVPPVDATGILTAIVAGIIFGYAAKFFVYLIEFIKNLLNKYISKNVYHPFIGGLFIAGAYFILGTDRYHSLGEEVIHSSFTQLIYPWDFFGKIAMAATSVGSGFKGGEVMSLFYIGSTLGNALSYILPMDYPILAALGFVSVFAGAVNTPMAGVILAFEFFGPKLGVYASLSVVAAFLFSGREGIYHSQKSFMDKNIR